MDRNSVDWRGYMPAITTPFDSSGDLDLVALCDLVEWLIDQRMHGLVVAGTTGEWFSLSPQEKRSLFKSVAQQVGGRIPVIAGCNAFTAIEAAEMVSAAHEYGCDGILLTPPPYVVPSDREIVEYYKTVARGSKLPICIYNWPPGTNIDMKCELIEKLVELDPVVALKNSSDDISNYCETFFRLKDRVRIFGFASNDLGLSLIQHHGLDGTMGAAAVLGSDHPDFFESIWRNDIETAMKLMERDRYFMKRLFNTDLTAKVGSAQAIFKEGLNLQGVKVGIPRPPILELSSEESMLVKKTLHELGIVTV